MNMHASFHGDNVDRMSRRFEGFAEAYGTYDGTQTSETKGKVEIKQSASTKRSRVTLDLWSMHLQGARPLGIIPVRDDNTCLWGCIDVDQYGVDLDHFVTTLASNKLPLIVCRSKSGGAHLFLFMAEPVTADLMQMRLKDMAA